MTSIFLYKIFILVVDATIFYMRIELLVAYVWDFEYPILWIYYVFVKNKNRTVVIADANLRNKCIVM